jgi:hypothetical protein
MISQSPHMSRVSADFPLGRTLRSTPSMPNSVAENKDHRATYHVQLMTWLRISVYTRLFTEADHADLLF